MCLFAERQRRMISRLYSKSQRVAAGFARAFAPTLGLALAFFGLNVGFLLGLCPPALDRLAEQPVPGNFKSPIGDLEFHTALLWKIHVETRNPAPLRTRQIS